MFLFFFFIFGWFAVDNFLVAKRNECIDGIIIIILYINVRNECINGINIIIIVHKCKISSDDWNQKNHNEVKRDHDVKTNALV